MLEHVKPKRCFHSFKISLNFLTEYRFPSLQQSCNYCYLLLNLFFLAYFATGKYARKSKNIDLILDLETSLICEATS